MPKNMDFKEKRAYSIYMCVCVCVYMKYLENLELTKS